MKILYKSLAIAALTMTLTSCAEETTLTEQLSQETQLKSYSLTTTADGSFVLEHTLSEGSSSSILSNDSGNEILISDGYSDSSTKSAVLPLLNNEIKIDFITENEVAIPGIKILDEKISTTASSKKIDYVKDYSISLLEDGSYQLNFTLAKNFTVNYAFNQDLNRHEINLVATDSKRKSSYSKKFLKFEGEKLNIVFLRSIKTTTLSSQGRFAYLPEPPEITID